jgi:hypothetical protein
MNTKLDASGIKTRLLSNNVCTEGLTTASPGPAKCSACATSIYLILNKNGVRHLIYISIEEEQNVLNLPSPTFHRFTNKEEFRPI